jgi:hypothetical protein
VKTEKREKKKRVSENVGQGRPFEVGKRQEEELHACCMQRSIQEGQRFLFRSKRGETSAFLVPGTSLTVGLRFRLRLSPGMCMAKLDPWSHWLQSFFFSWFSGFRAHSPERARVLKTSCFLCFLTKSWQLKDELAGIGKKGEEDDFARMVGGPELDAFLEPWRMHQKAVAALKKPTNSSAGMDEKLRKFYHHHMTKYVKSLPQSPEIAYKIVKDNFGDLCKGWPLEQEMEKALGIGAPPPSRRPPRCGRGGAGRRTRRTSAKERARSLKRQARGRARRESRTGALGRMDRRPWARFLPMLARCRGR